MKRRKGFVTQLRAALRYARSVQTNSLLLRLNTKLTMTPPAGWSVAIASGTALSLTPLGGGKVRLQSIGSGVATITIGRSAANQVTIPVSVTS